MTSSNYFSQFRIGRDKELTKKLILFQLCFIFIQDFLIYTLHFPSFLAYINDVITVLIIVYSFELIIDYIKNTKFKMPLYCILLFSIFCLIGAILNQVPWILLLYGIRQTFRFYVFLLACISALNIADVERFYKVLLRFQILNILLVIYEYFVLDKVGDYLGGLFGTTLSCNVPLNIFLCVLSTFAIVKYLKDETNFYNLAWVSLSCLGIASLAELKFFFIEFIIIVFLGFILCKPKKKKLYILLTVVITSSLIGLLFLNIMYPQQFEILTNPGKLIYYLTATDYDGAYTVSRLNFVEQIRELFFKDDIKLNLFGFGLGNCEYSSISFLISDFFKNWGYSFNYNWFSSSMRFLETGMLGVIAYLSFFISIIVCSLRVRKLSSKDTYSNISCIVAVLTILIFFYNDSLTKYVSYMIFFTLSLVFIDMKGISLKIKDSELIKTKEKMPNVIHYCWFGKGPLNELSEKCIASWKEKMPDYEIKKWDETNFDIEIIPYVKEAYENKKYAFVSDFARLYIVYHHGGIYLDTDIELVASLVDIAANGNFFATEQSGHINTGLGFGAKPHNNYIKKLMDDYMGLHFMMDGKIDSMPCPIRNTMVFEKLGYIKTDELKEFGDFTVYPSEFFCPKNYETNEIYLTGNTVSIHHFAASWYGKNDLEEANEKKKFIRIFGMFFGKIFYKIFRKIKSKF